MATADHTLPLLQMQPSATRREGPTAAAIEVWFVAHIAEPLVVGVIRQAVAEQHEVRASTVLLLKAGQLPKTSSGKIQRHACRNMFLAGNLDGIQRRPI